MSNSFATVEVANSISAIRASTNAEEFNDYFYNGSGCFDPTAGMASFHVDHQRAVKPRKPKARKQSIAPAGITYRLAWVNPAFQK